jgi:hypothetical protein
VQVVHVALYLVNVFFATFSFVVEALFQERDTLRQFTLNDVILVLELVLEVADHFAPVSFLLVNLPPIR